MLVLRGNGGQHDAAGDDAAGDAAATAVVAQNAAAVTEAAKTWLFLTCATEGREGRERWNMGEELTMGAGMLGLGREGGGSEAHGA